jgi:Z1 domain-containing protein
MVATIEVLKKVEPKLRWIPKQGDHTTEFLERKRRELGGNGDADPMGRVLMEAQTILGRCVPPTVSGGAETGLVVGYVQSGKTMSFTTLMALAKDNGYQLVVVIAGIATNLKSQSERRLAKDLGFDQTERAWVHFENPDADKGDHRRIQNALDMLNDPRMPDHKRRAVVITVLKNHTRLGNLVDVLHKLKLENIPALVIDDEADQASLNTKASMNRQTGRNEMSATYDWITQIKASLPHHTFIQYTATPQANLLISIAGVLSPSFAELLTPGDGYVGGEEFFGARPSLIETITASDIPSPTNILRTAPTTLQKAMRFFLLGAAVHIVTRQTGNRSMMVHPSQQTAPHADYKEWIEKALDAWTRYLRLPPSDSAFRACAELFKPEYKSLVSTHDSMPPFKDLLDVLPAALLNTRVVEVNSTQQGERDVKWHHSDYWILIGGQKLDRGFTVEGLTVTYMPRSIGTGNADTLQQRARFFGYKANYRGLCRVFLESATRDALARYVEHETSVRRELAEFRGKPLKEWKRNFLLTRNLTPTRQNVIGIDIRKVALDEGWIAPAALYRDGEAVKENRKIYEKAVQTWKQEFGCKDASTISYYKDLRGSNSPRNFLIEDVPVARLVEFLADIRLPDVDDSEIHTGLMFALRKHLEQHPDSLGDVFLIGNLEPQQRSLEGGKINQVFQGKTPNVSDFNKLIYVGDRALVAGGKLALHLRTFNLKNEVSAPGLGKHVPWFAVHLAAHQARDSVVQTHRRKRGKRS